MSLRRAVALLFVLGVVAIGAGIGFRNEIASAAIEAGLRARGVESCEVGAVEIGLRGVRIDGLRIGAAPDLSVESVRLGWTRASLRQLRLALLSIRGVRLAGAVDEDGARFGDLDRLLPAGGSGGRFEIPALPAARVEIEDATAAIETADGPMQIAANLTAGGGEDGIDANVDLDLAHPGFDGKLRLRGAGSARELDGTLALDVAPRASANKGLAFAADAMSTRGRFRLEGDTLSVDVDPFPFGITARQGGAVRRFEGRSPRLAVRLRPDRDEVHVDTEDGDLRLVAEGVEARGFVVSADLGARSSGRIRVQTLRDLEQPARWPPLAVDATFESDGGDVDFRIHAADALGRVGARADGRHAIEAGSGRAKVRLQPVRFADPGLRPGDLFPRMAKLVTEVAGEVEAVGDLAWSGGDLDGSFDLALRDLSGRTPAAAFSRVNAAVRVDGFAPPRTAERQLLSIARLDFGLDLTDGLIEYQLRPDGTVSIASAEWKLAGGRIRTSGTFDPAAEEQQVVLDVEALDLATLLQRVNLDDLSGTGSLTGRLPIVRRAGSILIRDGVLATVGSGVLRYRPNSGLAALPGDPQGFDTLLGALSDLHYDALEIRLDGDAGGVVNLKLHIRGANPNFQRGQAVEFNLSVEAPLADLIEKGAATARIPAEIEKRLGEIAAGR